MSAPWGCHLGGLCSVVSKLVAVVVLAHDHVHHSLHEGLEHVMVEALDWLDERLEGLTKTKSCKKTPNYHSSRFPQFVFSMMMG